MKTKILLLCITTLLYITPLKAQMFEEWSLSYHGHDNLSAQGSVVTTSANGNVYIAGRSKDATTLNDVFISKVSPAGDVIWTVTYNGAQNKDDIVRAITVDSNDNVYVVGNTSYTTNTIFILKYRSSGAPVWSVYSNPTITNGTLNKIAVHQNGNIYVSGYTSVGSNPKNLYTLKYDSAGNFQWADVYSQHKNSGFFASYMTLDADENIYVTGVGIEDSINTMTNFITIKYNSSGTRLWSSAYAHPDASISLTDLNTPRKVLVDDVGNVYVTGRVNFTATNYDFVTVKISSAGDTLWTRRYNGIANGIDEPCNMSFGENKSSLYVAGFSENSINKSDLVILQYDTSGNLLNEKKYPNTPYDNGGIISIDEAYNVYASGEVYKDNVNSYIYTIKCNKNGEKIWDASYDKDPGRDFQNGSIADDLENLYIIGESYNISATDKNSILIKYCGKCYSIISGLVYNDLNSNCIKDTSENGLLGWIVKIEPGDFYGTTDSSGYYCVFLPQGNTYTVSNVLLKYWENNCPMSGNYTIVLGDSGDVSLNNDFANKVGTSCPNLWVDMSARPLRKCMRHTYAVNYCNKGTSSVDDAYIKVTFEEGIIPLSSTLSWNNQTGNTFTFNIGTIDAGDCGSFYITDSISCSLEMGRTLCNEARIYPDTTCVPVSGTWDKSSVKVTGRCVGDSSVCFKIENTGEFGNGDMDDISTIRVYEDNVLFETSYFQLVGGDSIVKCYTANGKTIRLEADQRPGHPGRSHPRASVESCGDDGNPSLLLITSVPEDDEDDNVEIDCRIVVSSFDPNEKIVKPTGVTDDKYITEDDELEYQINFQNTGNDTAFKVVIRDTLSPYLDASTVVTGASSHPYEFKVYNTRILEWTFNNILLPDSNVNEPASNGFVKFKIKQVADNPQYTLIQNRAAIYFDYNDPVMTEYAWNIINKGVVTKINEAVVYNKLVNVEVYPNPFKSQTNFVVSGLKENETYNIVLLDVMGREVKKINKIKDPIYQLSGSDLNSGMYFYKVLNKKQIFATGKLIVN